MGRRTARANGGSRAIRAGFERIARSRATLRRQPGCRTHAGVSAVAATRRGDAGAAIAGQFVSREADPATADGSRPEALNAYPAGAKRALLSGVWRRRPVQPFAVGGAGRAR